MADNGTPPLEEEKSCSQQETEEKRDQCSSKRPLVSDDKSTPEDEPVTEKKPKQDDVVEHQDEPREKPENEPREDHHVVTKPKPTDKSTSSNETSPRSSRPWGLPSFATIGSFFSRGPREIRDKDYWLNLSLEEKRKKYHCKTNFVILDDILTWPQLYSKHLSSTATELSSEKSPNPLLNSKISLWTGDITKLEIDAIVNAANSSLMGGGGVDGAIHSAAGPSLRDECRELNGCETGDAKTSTGHRLPAKYIIHTVGPMNENSDKLISCYERCLEEVLRNNIRSVSFCCIATGVYGFPNKKAAHIALKTVRSWLETNDNCDKVDRIIFTVFLNKDYKIYHSLLPMYFPLDDSELLTTSNALNDSSEIKSENFIPSLQKQASEPVKSSQSTLVSNHPTTPQAITTTGTEDNTHQLTSSSSSKEDCVSNNENEELASTSASVNNDSTQNHTYPTNEGEESIVLAPDHTNKEEESNNRSETYEEDESFNKEDSITF